MEPLPPPSKRPLEGYKYTPKEQAEKDQTIKAMMRDFPTVPELWAEWVYDFCKQTPEDELNRMIESRELEKPSKFSPGANKILIQKYNDTRDNES